MRRLILLLLPIILTGQQAFHSGPSVQYWVDSVNGSDANNGLSSTAPLANLPTSKYTPDYTSFHFAKGSHWRGAFNLGRNNISVLAYGSGAAPIVDGSSICSSWSKTGGLTNTYQCTVTFDPSTVPDALNVFENGVYLTLKSSSAAVDAAAGSYFVSSISVSPATLFVRASDSTNPGTNGKTYEYTAFGEQVSAISWNGGDNRGFGWTINGIHTTKNLGPSGSMACGRNCTILNSTADYGSRHNLYCSDGCLIQDSTIADAYDSPVAPVLMALNETAPAGIGSTLRRVTFSANNSPQQGSTANAIIGHSSGTGSFGNVLLDTLTVSTNGGANLAFTNTNQVTIQNGSYAGETIMSVPTIVTGITYNGNPGTGGAFNFQAGGISSSLSNSNLTVQGMLVNFANGSTFTVQNSTITENGGAGAAMFYGPSTSGIVLNNSGNTFGGTTYAPFQLKSDASVTSNNNTWNNLGASTTLALYDTDYTSGNDSSSTPNITYAAAARWNLGSAHVSGSNIPDIDGKGLNLTFPGGGSNPTSTTPGVQFASGQFLQGPTMASVGNLSPGVTATAVCKWTATSGTLTSREFLVNLTGAVFLDAGNTAHTARAIVQAQATNSSTTQIDDGGWHAVTITQAGNFAHLFVDGVEQPVTNIAGPTINPSTNHICVGASCSNTLNWTGLIAYVEVGPGMISAPQMSTYYAGLKSSLSAQGVSLP